MQMTLRGANYEEDDYNNSTHLSFLRSFVFLTVDFWSFHLPHLKRAKQKSNDDDMEPNGTLPVRWPITTSGLNLGGCG
ncbi:hypothetical protein E3N88_20634 [Mikania micrantha]|uniref:Uncharacterized protein n=1 Tax=Mikania micrantha TaxID=192012 RepID=A0A5N6NHK3_9ASTR|nr:hypothetical protein E3N88_20634 [Mikania micrantha]